MNYRTLSLPTRSLLGLTDYDAEVNGGEVSAGDVKNYRLLGMAVILSATFLALALTADVYFYAQWADHPSGVAYAAAVLPIWLLACLVLERCLVSTMGRSDDLSKKRQALGIRVLITLGSASLVTLTALMGIYKPAIAAYLQQTYLSSSVDARGNLLKTSGVDTASTKEAVQAGVVTALADKLDKGELPANLAALKVASDGLASDAAALALTTADRTRRLREAMATVEWGSPAYRQRQTQISQLQTALAEKRREAATAKRDFEAQRAAYFTELQTELAGQKATLGDARQALKQSQQHFDSTHQQVDAALKAAAKPGLGALLGSLLTLMARDSSMWLLAALLFCVAAGLELTAVLTKFNMDTLHQKQAFNEYQRAVSQLQEGEFYAKASLRAVEQFWASAEGMALALNAAAHKETVLAEEAAVKAVGLGKTRSIAAAIDAERNLRRLAKGRPDADALQQGLREQLQAMLAQDRKAASTAV